MTADWLVELEHVKGTKYYGFAYYVPRGSVPPYPGHDMLRSYLDKRYPTAKYKFIPRYQLADKKMFDGTTMLIQFETEEDAIMFKLEKRG